MFVQTFQSSEIQNVIQEIVEGEIQCFVEFVISVRNVRYYLATLLCDKWSGTLSACVVTLIPERD
jgi:hypothetical protein